MPDILDQLDHFLKEQRSQLAGEEDREWRQRIEQKLDQVSRREPEKSRRELLEELAGDDAFLAELEAELAAEAVLDDPAPDEPTDDQAEAPDDSAASDEPAGIRWRRVKLKVPRIYSGEDEPEHVEYLDSDGETRVRGGRRRGQPVSEEWEEVEDDDEQGDSDDLEEVSGDE